MSAWLMLQNIPDNEEDVVSQASEPDVWLASLHLPEEEPAEERL